MRHAALSRSGHDVLSARNISLVAFAMSLVPIKQSGGL